jgi:hypothetical protein
MRLFLHLFFRAIPFLITDELLFVGVIYIR